MATEVEVGSHRPQPPIPLRSGSELDAPQLEGKHPSSMLHAMQLSELASERENCFRQGFSRGMRNRRKEAQGWHVILKPEFLQPGFSFYGRLEVDIFFVSKKTADYRSDLASEIA